MSVAGIRKRLKQKDLVAAIFVFLSEEYDRSRADSILDVEVPLRDIRRHLLCRFGIDYTSDAWICVQLGKYEEEIGLPLFRKREGPEGLVLGVARDMKTYFQKQHLYVTQKIKVANGFLELAMNASPLGPGPLSLLLGAGSTVTRIAEAIAEGLAFSEGGSPAPGAASRTWAVATHNLGVIQTLGRVGGHSARVELSVPEGRIDPVTNLILGRNADLYGRLDFHWIVEGTSFLKGEDLYVESPEETALKAAILGLPTGRKVLVLTGHEATASLPGGLTPYGAIGQYDYVIRPRSSPEGAKNSFDLAFDALRPSFETLILTWNYEVLRSKVVCRSFD